jgi:hypothetical protein
MEGSEGSAAMLTFHNMESGGAPGNQGGSRAVRGVAGDCRAQPMEDAGGREEIASEGQHTEGWPGGVQHQGQ